MQRDLDEHSRLLYVYWRTHNKLVLTQLDEQWGVPASDVFLFIADGSYDPESQAVNISALK